MKVLVFLVAAISCPFTGFIPSIIAGMIVLSLMGDD